MKSKHDMRMRNCLRKYEEMNHVFLFDLFLPFSDVLIYFHQSIIRCFSTDTMHFRSDIAKRALWEKMHISDFP